MNKNMKTAFASVAVGLAMTACGSKPVINMAVVMDPETGTAVEVNGEKIVGALVLANQGATNPNVVNVGRTPVPVSKLTTDFNGEPVKAASDLQQISGAIGSVGGGAGAAMSGYGNYLYGKHYEADQTINNNTNSPSAQGGAGGTGGATNVTATAEGGDVIGSGNSRSASGAISGSVSNAESQSISKAKQKQEQGQRSYNNDNYHNNDNGRKPQRECGHGRDNCMYNVKIATQYVPC